MQTLNNAYHRQHGDKVNMPREIRDKIQVAPIPRSMHTSYNQGRRKARAITLLWKYHNNKEARFTDAAGYLDGRRFAAAVNTDGKATHTATINTKQPEMAEEVAIALAMSDIETQVILSDSRTAVQNYAKGRILPEAFRILQSRTQARKTPITVIWFPGHMGAVCPKLANLNETANSAARDIIDRYRTALALDADKDWLTSYNEITKAFYLARQSFTPPNNKLCRAQATTWQQLQTDIYPNPLACHRFYPEIYPDSTCKVCGIEPATLKHMLWECEAKTKGINPNILSECHPASTLR